MAKIISFNSKKNNNRSTSSEAEEPSWTYKDRIRSHRLVIFYRIMLVVIIVVGITLAVMIQDKTRVFTTAEVMASTENHSIRTDNVVAFDGTILSYGMDGAACVDAEGKALWNVTYEMQNPMISVEGDTVAIGDYGSRAVYVMNTKGALGQITTTMPIYQFCVSSSGEIAVVLNDTNVTWIYLYDSIGNVLAYFKTTMRQSGFPMDLTISPNGRLVGVSYIYVDSGEMRSSVAFYNFGDVGQNETDNYVSGYNYDGVVVPEIRFMNNEYSFAVADDRIMFYKGSEKPVSQADHLISDEIQKVFYNDKYVGLVFYSDQADYRYHIEIYSQNGNKEDEFECKSEFRDIVINDDTAYIYSESKCMIRRIGGNVRYEGNLPKSTYLLIPGKKIEKFTTVNSDTVDTIVLK